MEHFDIWWIAWGCFLAAGLVLLLHLATKSHCILEGGMLEGFALPEIGREWDHDYRVPSSSMRGASYEINLYHMRCDCDHFRAERAQYSRLDARRLCMHLAREMETQKVVDTFDPLARAVVCHAARKHPPRGFAKVPTPSGPAWIAHDPGDRWLYVITPFSWPRDAEQRRDYTYAFCPKIWSWAGRKRPRHYPRLERCCNRIYQEFRNA
ncbi:MAG: hypothetical protein HQM03_14045 [Magnetococcales bacterium]|nr:hypothetical protein [Magnetococcales bacterium]